MSSGKSITFLVLLIFACHLQPSAGTYLTDDVFVSELFSLRVEPRMFNWTFQGLTEQFQYRPSLEGYPDLPGWVRYMYSHEYHSGFLYGTPPERTADSKVPIEIIALNKQTYETKRIVLILAVHRKLPPRNVIQMKIDNLNWVHMMDPGRIENLKNIFRNDLWQESRQDLHIIFMDSAVKLGARLPLKPQQREGVVVHLGSRADFSSRLLDLQEEVKPLYKIASCNYKRTSVQTTFENSGFKLDWCAFKMHAADDDITAMPHHPNEAHRSPSGHSHQQQQQGSSSELSSTAHLDKWDAPMKSEVPERNYSDEFAVSFAIPGMVFALLLSVLTVILCFQHEKLKDDDSEYYFDFLFNICTDFFRLKKSYRHEYRPAQPVQMVQYSQQAPVQPTGTLKSLKDAPKDESLSIRSASPSDSFYREGSPRFTNSYLRPKPPPYKPTGTSGSNNSTMQRKGPVGGVEI
ncbi:epsilon-sarcoglycan isoform X1 [Culex pipiens pallens]|uniref:epsilon-sarcoglycan isoform X1 n=1 Tax=Culex pipiens pallens TaxID=42434 RepID=UPI00195423AE|nr:epsilon-sarcoglycan isoform X1 [Culex pipiens pallens]